jgi:hypothetical protein
MSSFIQSDEYSTVISERSVDSKFKTLGIFKTAPTSGPSANDSSSSSN